MNDDEITLSCPNCVQQDRLWARHRLIDDGLKTPNKIKARSFFTMYSPRASICQLCKLTKYEMLNYNVICKTAQTNSHQKHEINQHNNKQQK